MGVSEILGGAAQAVQDAVGGFTSPEDTSPDFVGGKRRRRYRKKTQKK